MFLKSSRINLNKQQKRALHDALDSINVNDLRNLDWGPGWAVIHDLKTSALGGNKLATKWGHSDGTYHVTIIDSNDKQFHTSFKVSAIWNELPSGNEILTRLRNAIEGATGP